MSKKKSGPKTTKKGKKKAPPTKKKKTEETRKTEPVTETPEKEEIVNVDIVNRGDFVFIDVIGRLKDTEKSFYLTIEDVAKKEGVFREDGIYKPDLVIVGESFQLPALEDELIGMRVGETKTVEIPSEKAYGPKDAKKIKFVSLKKFSKAGVKPEPGKRVRMGSQIGTVVKVAGGRVQIDLNHPLAGQTLMYEVTIKEKILSDEEKVRSLFSRFLPAYDESTIEVTKKDEEITIKLPSDRKLLTADGLQIVKSGVARDCARFLGAKKVKYIEEWEVLPFPKTS
ncbi:MAG: FKBP-type peptidyl-prolyl cis-trans isomerase [Candidatus Hodarchaeota archaeon]